jgi:hypothetical protein
LIHHGREVREDEKEVVDAFFSAVWRSFARALAQAHRFQTRNDMFKMLEDRELF